MSPEWTSRVGAGVGPLAVEQVLGEHGRAPGRPEAAVGVGVDLPGPVRLPWKSLMPSRWASRMLLEHLDRIPALGRLGAGDAHEEGQRRRDVDGLDPGHRPRCGSGRRPRRCRACSGCRMSTISWLVAVLAEELQRDGHARGGRVEREGGRAITTTSPEPLGCWESLPSMLVSSSFLSTSRMTSRPGCPRVSSPSKAAMIWSRTSSNWSSGTRPGSSRPARLRYWAVLLA